MKLAFIAPTDFIKEFGGQGDFTLALAHLLPSGAGSQGSMSYEGAVKDAGLPIILDNGLFEKHIPEPIESLIDKAVKIGAHTFFAPDCLYDAESTQVEVDYAIALNKQKKTGIKVAAVVQANDPETYKKQLIAFNNNPEIDLIGLSILSIPESFESEIGEHNITKSRIHLMRWMGEYQDIHAPQGFKWKNMHLLGIGDSYEDVIFASNHCPWIISNDSSCAFQSGYFGKRLNDKLEVPGGKVKQKVIFGLMYITDTIREDVQFNINKIKSIICK